MTHPFRPHIFNSLGKISSASLDFLENEQRSPAKQNQSKTIPIFQKRRNYSIPTSDLMYCSLS